MNIPLEFQIAFIAVGFTSIFYIFSYLNKLKKLLFYLADIVKELEAEIKKRN